jgi:hypothetical protein
MIYLIDKIGGFHVYPYHIYGHRSMLFQSLSPSDCFAFAEGSSGDEKMRLPMSISRRALPTTTTSTSTPPRKYSWNERLAQLKKYLKEHGHTNVPKRYHGYGNLGLWIERQRRNYRKFTRGESTPLTARQIEDLDNLQFCWDASKIERHKMRQNETESDTDWWRSYHNLKSLLEASGQNKVALLPLSSTMSRWLATQRKELSQVNVENDAAALQRVHAMEQLDPFWEMSRYDLQWELMYLELLDYREKYGDFNVPISFHNKKLANWVSNQRKQYNLLQRKKPSLLTKHRLKRLEAIAFVWNRWEDAFDQKDVYRQC